LIDIVLKYFTEFSNHQLAQLAALENLYREWNEKINVISRKDIDSLYEKHVLHSLSIAAVFDLQAGLQVIDLGTGGGFPGIPLAIFFPDVQFHLVDSVGKKLKVVEAITTAIGVTNLTTQHSRAEDIKNRKFDLVVSRAVAPLKDLWQWGRPLLKKSRPQASGTPDQAGSLAGRKRNIVPNGLICLKGGDLAQEIADSKCKPRQVEIYEIFREAYFKEKHLLYIPI
jgi:16S rRNA (guanine527-N7)-methyltransferase